VKKKYVVIGVVLVLMATGLGAARANAAVTWPAKCQTFACVNAHMNNLHNRLKAAVAVNATQTRRLNNHQALFNCEAIVPLTQYGDPGGTAGYEFNAGAGTVFRSALDVTADGDTVDAWFLVDACQTATTPRAMPRRAGLRPHLTGLQR
jgi:hypothetical protein